MVAVAKAAIEAVPALLANPTTAGLARGAVIVVGIAGATYYLESVLNLVRTGNFIVRSTG